MSWFKDRDWLFIKRVKNSPLDLRTFKRTYYFSYGTLKDPKEWRWTKTPIVASTAVEAIKEWRKCSENWTFMSYEIAFCVQTQETLYIKTEYSNFQMKAELMLETPTAVPHELDLKSEIQPRPSPTSIAGPGIPVSL